MDCAGCTARAALAAQRNEAASATSRAATAANRLGHDAVTSITGRRRTGRNGAVIVDGDRSRITAGSGAGAQCRNANGRTTATAAAADRLRGDADGIVPARCDRTRRIVGDIYETTIACAAATAAEGHQTAGRAGIAAGATNALRHDPVGIIPCGDDGAVIPDGDRCPITAGAAGIGVTHNAETGAGIAGCSAHRLREDTVCAETDRADGPVIDNNDRAAFSGRSG